MKNDKELYDDEIEEKKRTVVVVLKYLACPGKSPMTTCLSPIFPSRMVTEDVLPDSFSC